MIEGYDNWYLPGASELNLIHTAIYDKVDLGVFTYDPYWSSNQVNENEAYSVVVNGSSAATGRVPTSKSTECCVRAVHTF